MGEGSLLALGKLEGKQARYFGGGDSFLLVGITRISDKP